MSNLFLSIKVSHAHIFMTEMKYLKNLAYKMTNKIHSTILSYIFEPVYIFQPFITLKNRQDIEVS